MSDSKLNIAFFGTPDIAVIVLEELRQAGIIPNLIVTNPDRPQGRSLTVTPSDAKIWATANNVAVFQPESFTSKDALIPITSQTWDLFIVVAYGQIMPKWLIDLPKHGTLNVHPSMLPKLRGASPIRTSILEGLHDVGVSIMQMDEKMDHGPILTQLRTPLSFPVGGRLLDENLAHQGGLLLADCIPKWIKGEITPQEQNHEEATYCKKITKDMGELHIDPLNLPTGEDAYKVYLKICAFNGWPGTFFFYNGKRIKITEAYLAYVTNDTDQSLVIHKVIPEGKKEMDFEVFLKKIT